MLCIPTDRRLPKIRLRSRQLHRLLGQVRRSPTRLPTVLVHSCLPGSLLRRGPPKCTPTSPARPPAANLLSRRLPACLLCRRAAPGAAAGWLGPGQPLPARPPGAQPGPHQLPQVSRPLEAQLPAAAPDWGLLAATTACTSCVRCSPISSGSGWLVDGAHFHTALGAAPCRSETDGVLVSSGVHWQPFRWAAGGGGRGRHALGCTLLLHTTSPCSRCRCRQADIPPRTPILPLPAASVCAARARCVSCPPSPAAPST